MFITYRYNRQINKYTGPCTVFHYRKCDSKPTKFQSKPSTKVNSIFFCLTLKNALVFIKHPLKWYTLHQQCKNQAGSEFRSQYYQFRMYLFDLLRHLMLVQDLYMIFCHFLAIPNQNQHLLCPEKKYRLYILKFLKMFK